MEKNNLSINEVVKSLRNQSKIKTRGTCSNLSNYSHSLLSRSRKLTSGQIKKIRNIQ